MSDKRTLAIRQLDHARNNLCGPTDLDVAAQKLLTAICFGLKYPASKDSKRAHWIRISAERFIAALEQDDSSLAL